MKDFRKTHKRLPLTETIRRLEGLRKDVTKTVAFRLDPRDADRLEAETERQGLRTAQLVKTWVIQRARE